MPIFKVKSDKLSKLNALPLYREKKLQTLLENNLMEVFEVIFLASEYTTTFGGRIDTLAVDSNGAPVIIEYKRNRNDNVINQSLSYLRWLTTQKSGFFEKLMIDKLDPLILKSIKLDWNNPRVICIAESYSKFDIDTVEVIPLRIELFKYRYYEDDIFGIEPVTVSDTIAEKIDIVAINKDSESVHSIDRLKEKASLKIQNIFDVLEERIMEMDETIEEKATSFYIAFKVSKNFAEIHIGKNKINVHLRPIDYVDPKGLVNKIPDGYNWTLDRRLYLDSFEDLDYVLEIIEQSYKNIL